MYVSVIELNNPIASFPDKLLIIILVRRRFELIITVGVVVRSSVGSFYTLCKNNVSADGVVFPKLKISTDGISLTAKNGLC